MNIQTHIKRETEYDTDFSAWLIEQARRLRAREVDSLDWDNLAEEIETLGRSEARELATRLTVLLEHLIKHEYGLNRDSAFGWERTIVEQRRGIIAVLEDSPSLRRRVPELARRGYPDARDNALASLRQHEPDNLAEYKARIPQDLPHDPNTLLNPGFLPEPPTT